MYTTETSDGSDNIAAQRQVSPNTNRYLVPGLSFEGGIFKEQQKTFLTRLVLPNLPQMFNGQQQTTFLTQEYHASSPKSLDEGSPGWELWVLGWATRLNLRAGHTPRACRLKCSPKGPKLGFKYLPTYKTLHFVRTVCALHAHCVYSIPLMYSPASPPKVVQKWVAGIPGVQDPAVQGQVATFLVHLSGV